MTADPARWAVIIPIRGADPSKSRLDHPRRRELARSFALDTVRAAAGATRTARIVVVIGRHAQLPAMSGIRVVRDDGRGLDAAVRLGLASVPDPTLHRAVLLGDLPSLRSVELDDVLERAELVPRAFVADADGTGTTISTARTGVAHRLRFGAGSATAHRRVGHVELRVPVSSGIRRDVDDAAGLVAAVARGTGRSTAAVLACLSGS
ncbi:MAG: 2-phospho-L-lactate guanylyltransferase [Naasia sp.]